VPEVAVTVTVAVPAVTEGLAASVRVLVPVVLAGLKDAVTPFGRPDAARLTLLLKPLWGPTVMVLAPLLPRATARLLGDAVRLKFGTVITRPIVAVWVSVPEVAVIVIVAVPAVAEGLAVSVRVLVPVVLAGLKDTVTPLGWPDAARLTLPLKPFCGPTVRVLTLLFPCTRLRLLGDAERLKFGTVITRPIEAVWLKLPEVPVTVTVAVPAVAEGPAANVRVLDPVVLAVLNDAVTPFGRPDAARLTLPLKPLCGPTVRVLTPLFPCTRLRLLGDAERLKFGTVITRPIEEVWLKLPEVPVTVTVAVPAVAEGPAASVRVLDPVVFAGLKDAVTPFGRPDAARLTPPLKPLSGPTARVLTPLFPCTRLRLLGDAERVKFGTVITRLIEAVWLKLPEVPVTVTVAVPAVAAGPATNVRVLDPTVLAGLNDAVTPFGRPDTVKLTRPVKPFCGPTARVLTSLFP
jgi:hypothetical protein